MTLKLCLWVIVFSIWTLGAVRWGIYLARTVLRSATEIFNDAGRRHEDR